MDNGTIGVSLQMVLEIKHYTEMVWYLELKVPEPMDVELLELPDNSLI